MGRVPRHIPRTPSVPVEEHPKCPDELTTCTLPRINMWIQMTSASLQGVTILVRKTTPPRPRFLHNKTLPIIPASIPPFLLIKPSLLLLQLSASLRLSPPPTPCPIASDSFFSQPSSITPCQPVALPSPPRCIAHTLCARAGRLLPLNFRYVRVIRYWLSHCPHTASS